MLFPISWKETQERKRQPKPILTGNEYLKAESYNRHGRWLSFVLWAYCINHFEDNTGEKRMIPSEIEKQLIAQYDLERYYRIKRKY